MKRLSVLCMFMVLVYMTYVVSGQTTLTLGQAHDSDLAKDTFVYFTLPQLSQPITGDNKLIFTLTSYSGDSDLYLSTTNQNPGPNNYDLKSSSYGEDLIQINSTDSTALRTGPWYLGVQAYHVDTFFSLLAYTLPTHIILRDGVPQVAHASWREFTYFKYEATAPGTFSISSTSIYGDPDIYISDINEYPDRLNFTQRQTGVGTDLLVVTPPATATFPKTYYIGVYAFGGDAHFNLEITHADANALLSAGIPLFERIASHQFMYFKFKLTMEADVTFKVTKKGFSGDPDLYISTTSQKPNATDNQWKGQSSFRSEEVTIVKGSTGWIKGWYYIGVYVNSLFTTEVTVTALIGGSHIILTTGNTLPGYILANKPLYYKAFYQTKRGDHAQYVEYTVSPTDGGEVDVYASSTNQFPTKDNYEFKGSYVLSSNVIHINEPKNGWYYISLVPKTDVSYTITASQAKLFVSLDNGQSQSFSILAGQYRDFGFSAASNDADVLISVHSFSGDADFYVGIEPNVSRNHYIWGSYLGNSDVLTISKNDPIRQTADFNNQFFIAVYGFRDSYFSISAFYANTTIDITDGVPVSGLVQYHQYQYYRYTLTNAGSLSFNLRGLEGDSDPDLYVATEYPNPTRDHKQWESWKSGDDFLNIPNAAPGDYYIGVYGYKANTTFILSVSADFESLSSFGYSIVDYVAAGQYRYYATYLYPDSVNPMVTGVTLISGDTELYVSKNASKPSREMYDYKDVSWPGNFLTIPASNITFGRWMYAVYGVESSYYLIHTSTRELQGALRRGEPKVGVVKKGTYALFRLSYFTGPQDGTYYAYVNQITKIPGRVGVYVDQFPNLSPNATNAKWKAEGQDDILVNLDGMSTTASIYVAVYAYDQDTRFQIVVAETSEPVYLTEEQPNKVRTKAGERNYFEVPALPDATQIDVIAASCSDTLPPTIYGSITNKKPDATNNDFATAPDGKYRQKALFKRATNHLYYLGTDAPTSEFVFSIYATTAGDLRPVPTNTTLSIGDVVSTEQQRIHIPIATGRLPIRYFMYKRILKDGEDPANINMETVCAIQNIDSGSQLIGEIDVPPNVPEVLAYDIPVYNDQRYIINVVAVDAYGLASPYKQINYNLGKTNVINLGRALRSSVNGSQYEQLTLSVKDIEQNGFLVLSLTPYSGDVDLYVSTTPNPTKDNAIWKGTGGGFDIITIQRSVDTWPADGNFYVAVYGVSPYQNTFSIMAYTNMVTQTLQDGQPQLAKVDLSKYTYFEFDLEDNSTFTITLTPIDGDSDIIASNKFFQPTKMNADWISEGTTIDMITVRPTDRAYLAYTKYYIGVYGFSASKFSIVATKQYSSELVTEGVPHGGNADPYEYEYYKFQLTSPRNLVITVTSFTENADPDIYVSTTIQRPTVIKNTWRRDKVGGVDTLVIPTTDADWKLGWYYIGVRAFRIATTFQITVVSEEFSYLLADGAAQRFNAIEATSTYFKAFYGYQRNTLTFTANAEEENSIELYCASSTSKPDKEKHDFVGQTEGAYLYVTIDPNSKIGWYYCSVFAKKNTTVDILAATGQRPTALFDGRMDLFNYVESSYYAYFTFDFDPALKRDITISTMADFGDPDLFVSYNYTRPTKEQNQFGKMRGGGDTVIVTPDTLPAGTSRLYIGVLGYVASRFSIVAFSTNETIELQDATPIPGFVKSREYKQYKYELTNTGRVKFSLNVLGNLANADLYVDDRPNPSEAQYKYKGEVFGADTIEFNGRATVYYIAVYAGPDPAAYTIAASTEYETISVGSYVTDYANANNYRYYRANIPSIADHVLASVTLINGKTEFYAHPGEEKPSRSNYTFSSIDYPGNFLYVQNTDKKFKSGTWTFAVYAPEDSDYFVSVQYKEGTLYNGIPRVGYVTPGGVNEHIYYAFRIGLQTNITVNLRPFVDPTIACIRVYASQNTSQPSSSNYEFTAVSEAKFGNQIVMSIGGVATFTNLYFGVESCSGKPEKYEIAINNNVDVIYLTQNYPALFSAAASQYSVLTAKHSSVLSITLDSCDHIPATNMRLVASTVYHDENPPYVGESLNTPFTVEIMSDTVKGNEKYFVGVTHLQSTVPSVLSIFTTTLANDPRPKVGMLQPNVVKKQKAGKVTQNVMEVAFNGEKNHLVQVYLHEVTDPIDEKDPNAILRKVNMATVCGIRTNNNLAIVANTTGAQPARFVVDVDKSYILGAIVTDVQSSTDRAYSPVVILKGGKVVLPGLKFSVGALFIFFAMIALVAYLIIGISYNLIKGQENGYKVIPFAEFWADLPVLVIDGVKFIIYCGRGNNYSVFEDEGAAEAYEDEPNPFKVSNVDNKTSTSSSSGYGAI